MQVLGQLLRLRMALATTPFIRLHFEWAALLLCAIETRVALILGQDESLEGKATRQ